jgi:hypothetical protein
VRESADTREATPEEYAAYVEQVLGEVSEYARRHNVGGDKVLRHTYSLPQGIDSPSSIEMSLIKRAHEFGLYFWGTYGLEMHFSRVE